MQGTLGGGTMVVGGRIQCRRGGGRVSYCFPATCGGATGTASPLIYRQFGASEQRTVRNRLSSSILEPRERRDPGGTLFGEG